SDRTCLTRRTCRTCRTRRPNAEGGPGSSVLPVPVLGILCQGEVAEAFVLPERKGGFGGGVALQEVDRTLSIEELRHLSRVGEERDRLLPDGPPAEEAAGARLAGQVDAHQELLDVHAGAEDHPWNPRAVVHPLAEAAHLLQRVDRLPLLLVEEAR